ncbi:hypothetical protein OEZ86_004017 [Tetradesmus obliquus]|nr:hypothetical protein OEZ86_004017 [Tetradesmus obliquus]
MPTRLSNWHDLPSSIYSSSIAHKDARAGLPSGLGAGLSSGSWSSQAAPKALPAQEDPLHQGRHAACACLAMGATIKTVECRHVSAYPAPLALTQLVGLHHCHAHPARQG